MGTRPTTRRRWWARATGVVVVCGSLFALPRLSESVLVSQDDRQVVDTVAGRLESALSGRPRPGSTAELTRWVREAAPALRAEDGRGGGFAGYAVLEGRTPAAGRQEPVAIAVWYAADDDHVIELDAPEPYQRTCARVGIDADAAKVDASVVRCPGGLPALPPAEVTHPGDGTPGDRVPVLRLDGVDAGGPLVRGSGPVLGETVRPLLVADRRSVEASSPDHPCLEEDVQILADAYTTAGTTDDVELRAVNVSTSACRIDQMTALAPASVGPTNAPTHWPVAPAPSGQQPAARAGSVVLAPLESARAHLSWRPGPADESTGRTVAGLGSVDVAIRPGAGMTSPLDTTGAGEGFEVTGWGRVGYGAPPHDTDRPPAVAAPCDTDQLAVVTRPVRSTSSTEGAVGGTEALAVNIGATTCRIGTVQRPFYPDLQLQEPSTNATADSSAARSTVLVPGTGAVLGTTPESHPGHALVRDTWIPVKEAP